MTNDMTEGNPLKLIFKFATPLLLGQMLQQFYSLVDATIVGRFLGINALAGVGASTSVTFLILGFCNGCCGGFGIPIAQRFGAKDYSRMRQHVCNSLYLSIGISVIVTILTCLLCGKILFWMQTPEVIYPEAYSYLLFTFIGIPFTFLYNLLASIIRALGDSKTPFYFLVLSAALNILLDLVFILLFHWGVAGAAIATTVAQGVSALLCIQFMRHKFGLLQTAPQERKLSIPHMRELLVMGIPMGLQFSITAIGSIMLQSSNNALGTICVTAFTAGMRIKMFFMCPLENLGVAMATYCGQNLGAKKIDRIHSGLVASWKLMASYSVIAFIILQLGARLVAQLFVSPQHTEILDKAEQFLHISVTFYLLLGTLCLLRYSIQGLGFSRLAMLSGVFEMADRILVSLFIVPLLGYTGVCYGDPSAWLAALVFLIPAYVCVYKKLQRRAALARL